MLEWYAFAAPPAIRQRELRPYRLPCRLSCRDPAAGDPSVRRGLPGSRAVHGRRRVGPPRAPAPQWAVGPSPGRGGGAAPGAAPPAVTTPPASRAPALPAGWLVQSSAAACRVTALPLTEVRPDSASAGGGRAR